jgi:hypothetical protein
MRKKYTLRYLKSAALFALVFMTGQVQAQLYSFTSHTFTPAGASGQFGPLLTDCQTAYASEAWVANTAFFNMNTQGIQEWTVPVTGSYSIESFGGEGGDGFNDHGMGAQMYGEFTLTEGDVIYILVGQSGGDDAVQGGGGGGGSFVWSAGSNLLIAAGGGGGGSDVYSVPLVSPYLDGQNTELLTYNSVAGSGGPVGTSPSWMGGGGAGWNSNGASNAQYGQGGISPANGGFGADPYSGYASLGGFGGGGGAGYDAGGGGGGYTGGNGGTYDTNAEHAGGGGSFNGGTNPSSSTGVNTGDGSVVITLLCNPITTTVSSLEVCEGELVTLTASGAGTMTWNNGVVNGTPFANPVGTATYTVTSTDNGDCAYSVDITTNTLPVVEAFTNDSVICLGDSIILYGSGADSYMWNNGVIDSVYFTPTTGGAINYSVDGTNTNGCVVTSSINVFVSELELTALVTNENVGSDGEIDLTTIGGAGTYSFTWSNGSTTEDINGLAAATYTVSVNDGGCVSDTSFTILNVAGLSENQMIEVTAYPNPSEGVFTLEMDGEYSFQVINVNGKILLDGSTVNSTTIDLTNYSNGIYFVQLVSNDAKATVKLIKE